MIPDYHGGNIQAFAAKYALDPSRVLDFSSCVNPLGPPKGLKQVFAAAFDELLRYPDPRSLLFAAEAARHYPLWPENVMAAEGETLLLDLALQVLAPRKAVLLEPGFSEYRRLLNRRNVEVRGVLLEEKYDFQPQMHILVNALQGQDVLIIGHPGNPAGTSLSREDMLELLGEARRRNVFVIVDESHVDWNESISVAREIKDSSSFLVLRSLSHFYALPGLGFGYAFGARKMIERMQSFQTPWPVSGLAQKLGVEALRDPEFRQRSETWLAEERGWFVGEAQKLEHFRCFSGRANSLLMKVKAPWSPGIFLDAAARSRFYVRRLNDVAGIDNSCFRVGLRLREENRQFLDFLARYREEAGSQAQKLRALP